MEKSISQEFREFLRESDVTEKRKTAVDISSKRTIEKSREFEFIFDKMIYKIDKPEFPKHPSAEFEHEFKLLVKTQKGDLYTKFTYKFLINDYLNNIGRSSLKIQLLDLVEYEAFLNGEEFKIDKGSAKKISTNFKLDERFIKEELKKVYLKYTNYDETVKELESINTMNNKFHEFNELIKKSDKIEKIVKKYNHPIQKMVYYNEILVLSDSYLNEQMRKSIKKELERFETELWSIDDGKTRITKTSTNNEVISKLKKICSGKMIYFTKNTETTIQL